MKIVPILIKSTTCKQWSIGRLEKYRKTCPCEPLVQLIICKTTMYISCILSLYTATSCEIWIFQ